MTISNYVIGQCQNCKASYCVEERVYRDDIGSWRTIDYLQMCCSESDIITDNYRYGTHRVKGDLGYDCIQLPDDEDPIVWSDVIIGNEPNKPSRFDLLDMDEPFGEPKPEPEQEKEEEFCQECKGQGQIFDITPSVYKWIDCNVCAGTGKIQTKEKVNRDFLCEKCLGYGYIFSKSERKSNACNECEGTGRIILTRQLPGSDEYNPPKEWASQGVTHVIYDYHIGDYSGNGNTLIKKNGQWYNHNMGHCSCNGPWENADLENPIADKLVEIRYKVSKECWEEVKELVKMALVSGWS